jgi:Tfp pilus assembly protein PilO
MGKHWQIDAVGIVVCLAAWAATYLIGFQGPAESSREEGLVLAELQVQQNQARRLGAARSELEQELAAKRKAVETAPIQLGSARHMGERLTRIAGLVARCGLDLAQVRIGDLLSGPHFDVLPIRLVGQGSYPACALFLERVRTALPDTRLAELRLALEEPGQARTTGFDFRTSWLVYKEASGSAPVERSPKE